MRDFGPGERAAINLVLGHRDWVLLIYNRRSFLEAERMDLRGLCTPVLAVELYSEGNLDARQALGVQVRSSAMHTVSPRTCWLSFARVYIPLIATNIGPPRALMVMNF